MIKSTFNLLLLILNLIPGFIFGQRFDIETQRIKGIKKLVEYYFDGCDANTDARTRYEFDFAGNVRKEFNYSNNRLSSQFQYDYNEKDLLIREIKILNNDNGGDNDTIKYSYKFDNLERIIFKEIKGRTWVKTYLFQDFDSANNAQTIVESGKKFSTTYKKKFNKQNLPTSIQTIEMDSIIRIEEINYNDFGDPIYSYVPTLLDNSTGKMFWLIGGNRHSVIEKYEYKYDDLNRWTEKYVIYDNKKLLVRKRLYR